MHINHSHPANLHGPSSVPRGGAVFAHLFHHGLPKSTLQINRNRNRNWVLWICESPRASAFVSAKMARASGLWDSGTLPITWKGIHFRIQRNMCGTWMNIAFCWSPSRSAMQQLLLQGPARVRFKLEWAMICDKQWQTACKPLCCPFQDLVISEWMILLSTDCSRAN